MKFALPAALAFALACGASSAFAAAAAAPAKTLTPQQQKMSDCSKDAKAKGLKGADRKTFMSTCLKGDSTAAAPAAAAAPAVAAAPAAKPTQQEKMKTCNADAGAKHLTGDARKTFMSTCLSNSGAPAAH
jgi:hypothetical protein